MKPKSLFWGLFFISFGLLFLLRNTVSVVFDMGFAGKFWPVVLILLGVGYIVKEPIWRQVLSGLAGVATGVFFFSLITIPMHCGKIHFKTSDEPVVNKYTEPYSDSVKMVRLHFAGGAGSFNFSGGATELVKIDASRSKPNFGITSDRSDSTQEINISMEDVKINIDDSLVVGNVNVYLNSKPVYDVSVETGAASLDLDFRKLTLRDVSVKVGAASLVVRLGTPVDMGSDVSIDAGASSIEISLPADFEAELVTDLALSSKDISGLKSIGDNVYRTGSFDSTEKSFKIHVSGGVSSLKVTRGN